MWSFSNIANSIHEWLSNNFNPTWTIIIEMVIAGVAVISLFALLGLVLVIMERKVSAWMQIRLGPNRVGPKGMFQSLADTLKLLVKEGLTPGGAGEGDELDLGGERIGEEILHVADTLAPVRGLTRLVGPGD